jgi:membrane protein required for colicin V production
MVIDSLFVVCLIIAIIKGYTRGVIVAVFSFLSIFIGLAAALKLAAVVASGLQGSLNVSGKWLPLLSFALVMFVVVLLVRWGAKVIETTVDLALMGWLNKILGILLYAAIYITLLSTLIFFADKMNIISAQAIEGSHCYPFVKPWAHAAIEGFGNIIPFFKGLFAQLELFFSSIGDKVK